jgi:ribose 5-phosphate isomerase A
MITADQMKAAAAEAAALLVEDGMIVGLGSGSTAALAVSAIGKRVAGGLRLTGIPTSEKTAAEARSLGIPLSTMEEHHRIDLTIDGADEVERGTLNLIKGRGGALLREKIVASASERLVIAVDETKLVDRLCPGGQPIPVEVETFGWQAAAERLRAMSAGWTLRLNAEHRPFVTDGGHFILDCVFPAFDSAIELQRRLDEMVGIVENGLFLGMTSEVFVGHPDGRGGATADRMRTGA